MVQSNKVIYPYKVGFKKPFSWEKLKTEFTEKKEYDNAKWISEKKCTASLTYLDEKEDILFFSLSKCDEYNITVADFEEKKDHHSYLKEQQKVKNYSLFAVLKKYNILLTLYNYKAFGFLTPTLYLYFKTKLDAEMEPQIMTKNLTEQEITNLCKTTTHIIVKRARRNYQNFADTARGSSRRIIRRYTESEEEIIKLQRIHNLPVTQKVALLNPFRKKKYDKIIINAKNIGNVDILDRFRKRFACNIPVDKDGLSSVEKFKEEILNICADKKNISFFQDYQSDS